MTPDAPAVSPLVLPDCARRSFFTVGLAFFVVAVAFSSANAEPKTRVFINGRPVPVYFTDGDSFRILGGELSGRGTRLAGFNTLESFGPVHQWGDWHPYELFVIAKRATLNARRGVWHCTTEGDEDTYGRLLLDCPDLAIDQIKKGLAHAMTIDETPARPEYLQAQQEAIRLRRGMWIKGVPEFIVTSLHSVREDPSERLASNRLVSTRDGHSEMWEHDDAYAECTWHCATEVAGPDGSRQQIRSSCALYVAHDRRFGQGRPSCLDGHGDPPP